MELSTWAFIVVLPFGTCGFLFSVLVIFTTVWEYVTNIDAWIIVELLPRKVLLAADLAEAIATLIWWLVRRSIDVHLRFAGCLAREVSAFLLELGNRELHFISFYFQVSLLTNLIILLWHDVHLMITFNWSVPYLASSSSSGSSMSRQYLILEYEVLWRQTWPYRISFFRIFVSRHAALLYF